MRRRHRLLVAAAALAVLTATAAPRPAPWRDRTRPAAERAAALVKAMTRAEKLAYVHGFFPPYIKPLPSGMANAAGHVPGVPRLGIPDLRESDASLGVANNMEQRRGDTATALPASLAIAATFDPALARAGGAMIGAEARAKTFNVLLAGGVNLTRDAWGGRNFEYFGEDPLLSGRMAGASIAGVESAHIVSTAKHFALNAQETGRDVLDARIDRAALQESDLLAFRIAIEDGRPGAVMCAYNKVDGDYACENRWLLTDVLRGEWKYPGFVMSDWGAVHSTAKAALAGLDQESGQELDKRVFFGAPLAAAIDKGEVPAARLDEMVGRILTAVIASGLYDDPVPARPQPVNLVAHADVAQRVAEAGMVLLKNDRGVLPLAQTARRIVLIGGHADVGVLSGAGSSQVRSTGGIPLEITPTRGAAKAWTRETYHASSPLKALRAALPSADITYVDGSDPAAAARAARAANVAIVFATQWRTEAQDLPSLALANGQDALIDAVAGANANNIVVLETGGAVLMPWLDKAGAVVAAWYSGQRGGEALARLLTGEANFSGRLPLSFPRSEAQLPPTHPVAPPGTVIGDYVGTPFMVDYKEGADVGYRWHLGRGQAPLFAFGHGLSYASFASPRAPFSSGRRLTATVDVLNSGKRAGVAVPQLYLVGPENAAPRLVGWARVALGPGVRTRTTIEADPRLIPRYDAMEWRTKPGRYRLMLATSATEEIARGEVSVPATGEGREQK